MRKHYERILHDSESRVQRYLEIQILDENSPFCGGFPKADSLAEPKTAIYRATTMTACYLNPESRYYLDAELGRRLALALAFVRRSQRPGGYFDLINCNFFSGPDTAFCTKRLLQKAMKALLAQMKKQHDRQKIPHGKQTLKQLMKQNAGVSNIEITKDNIKAFESTAKKYGIDFALKKDSTETPPRYLVFFKGRDADALTAAFKEFSAKKLTQEQKPPIRTALSALTLSSLGSSSKS